MQRTKTVWTIVVLTLVGLGISVYLTWYDFTTPVGVCPPITSFLGCSAVLSSVYSRIGGIPVAVFGLLWFLVAAYLGMRVADDEKWLGILLGWSLVGLAGILALVAIEIFLVGQICLFCTAAHVVGLAILGLTVSLWKGRSK